jgi:hypothetical protein
MNLFDSKQFRAFFAGSLAIATVLGGCALAASDSSGSKNTPEEAAKDETPEVQIDVPVPGATDALANPRSLTGPVKNAEFTALDGTKIQLSYQETEGVNITEGDIILPTQIMSATSLGRYWPGGIVPYVIDTSLPSNSRVIDAIAHWESKTKLRFVPRTKERDYLHFRAGGGCSSAIGQQGGRQFVNLNTGEAASSVAAVGIDRSVSPERVTWFYKRGYATTGTLKSADQYSNHFRYIMPPGKAQASMIDVSIAKNGHVFAFFDDGTFSEGSLEDFSVYAQPKPYILPQGKLPTDVAGFAFDKDDQAFAFFKDGTVGKGTPEDMSAAGDPLVLAEGKSYENLAKVEYTAAGENPGFIAFYAEMKDGVDGGAPFVGALPYAVGLKPLAKTTFTGHCSAGATIHEIGHAMGLFHEQTRHDRDQFVKINWENVTPETRFNFEKHSKTVGTDTGPYDFDSIMHYGPTAFSIDNEKKTIERLDGKDYEEQRDHLSDIDLMGVAAMYGSK